jgi:hypothetical protein
MPLNQGACEAFVRVVIVPEDEIDVETRKLVSSLNAFGV